MALTRFAHLLEDLLVRMRRREIPVTESLITLLLQSVDELRYMVPLAAAGNEEMSESQTGLLSRLAGEIVPEPGDRLAEISLDPGNEEKEPPSHKTESIELKTGQSNLNRPGTLRVDMEKLDRMLNLTGEMAVARERIRQMLEGLDRQAGESILEAYREEDRLHMELQELVLKARMEPIGPTFRRYIRTVRDIAKAHGKVAALTIQDEEVEVDTKVIEMLKDPLTHMIRNALDHGIEAPDARKAAGKNACGELLLSASHEAGSIVIKLTDDGAGLNRRRILALAMERGLVGDLRELTDEEILRFVFEPGFSTADRVTDLSGRGIGLDVVRRNIEALRGSVTLESKDGVGTTVTIRLPLTLAIIDGFSVAVADETYVIPLDRVLECVELPAEERRRAEASGVLNLRGEVLPYIRLRHLFDLGDVAPGRENVVVVQSLSGRAGLVVDFLHGKQQTVIKPLGELFRQLNQISGSAILGNGRVALVLDVQTIVRDAIARELDRVTASS